MKGQLIETVLTEQQIQQRVADLGAQITEDYRNEDSLICLGILKGCTVFMSDLIRKIPLECVRLEYMRVSSYGGSTESSGVVRMVMDLDDSIEGKNVLIVEDIVDTCLTMSFLIRTLKTRKPKSIRVCSLLRKDNAKVDVPIDYVGFDIDKSAFVVGYGLDVDEQYRNLPYIAVFKPDPQQ